jgi:hypothetical protein
LDDQRQAAQRLEPLEDLDRHGLADYAPGAGRASADSAMPEIGPNWTFPRSGQVVGTIAFTPRLWIVLLQMTTETDEVAIRALAPAS